MSGAMRDHLHGGDLFLWSRERAKPLEQRRFGDLDLANLVDEVRSSGSSGKREIRNRPAVLLMHPLGWRHQPGRRSSSRDRTIADQGRELADAFAHNPSLRGYPSDVIGRACESARLHAARQIGLDLTLFPTTTPFTAGQTLDPDFLP